MLGGITNVVFLPLRVMADSGAGQQATCIVNGMFGEAVDVRGDALRR